MTSGSLDNKPRHMTQTTNSVMRSEKRVCWQKNGNKWHVVICHDDMSATFPTKFVMEPLLLIWRHHQYLNCPQQIILHWMSLHQLIHLHSIHQSHMKLLQKEETPICLLEQRKFRRHHCKSSNTESIPKKEQCKNQGNERSDSFV